MSYKITFKLNPNHYKKLEEMSLLLSKRGLKGSRNNLVIKEMILNEVLSYISPDCYQQIIEKITPLEFLYKEGIKDPLVKKQLEQILRKTKIKNKQKQTIFKNK